MRKILLIVIALILVLNSIFASISYYCFKTTNYFKSFYAMCLITSGKENYVEISGYPNWVILGAPDGSVYDKFLSENGYQEDESQRMGYEHIIKKDSIEERVHFEVNFKYNYSLIHS